MTEVDFWIDRAYINAIQIHYSNGVSSNVYKGPAAGNFEKKTIKLNDARKVRKFQGTRTDWRFRQLILKADDGSEVARI